ncbi:MAG: tyrosine-protein phosphatase [Puniceicoccales bacterium]|jgi:protein tyrosine/serine phosphatase|nr:tyrosine-protein phosphatase [Puniceicoccales bacterium]
MTSFKFLAAIATVITLCLTLLVGCWTSTPEPKATRPTTWAQPVIPTNLGNFHKVSEELFRSEYPTKENIAALRAVGIKTVINLRSGDKGDAAAFRKAGFTTHWLPMKASNVSVENLVATLRHLQNSPKPALIHCWHGSDRTGFIIAGYRIVNQGWSTEEAIREMRKGGFGFHEIYDNIIDTLQTLDIEKIRCELNTIEKLDGKF